MKDVISWNTNLAPFFITELHFFLFFVLRTFNFSSGFENSTLATIVLPTSLPRPSAPPPFQSSFMSPTLPFIFSSIEKLLIKERT